jgi:ribosomal protein L7/L12
MDTQLLLTGLAMLLVGFVLGRMTARPGRRKVIYEAPRTVLAADPAADAELVEHLRAGRKLDAIKRHRELYGTGLKEAKDAVEALEARLGR